MSTSFTRRTALRYAGLAAAAPIAGRAASASPIFDGKTLNGWLQIENSATTLGGGGITDQAAFAAKLAKGTDPVSEFVRAHLSDAVKEQLAAFSPETAKATVSALVKELNALIAGPSIYEKARFAGVKLRPETEQLMMLKQNPPGQRVARLNKILLEDAYPAELAQSVTTGWIVKDGAMASTGVGRSVIYTAKDYGRFRWTFTMRHVSGNPDHQACVLIFCTRPAAGEKPLDALAGIQFQVPNGGHWDYRPGMDNAGNPFFTTINKVPHDIHDWSRVEIVADAAKGVARMAVAQPGGSKAIEILAFKDQAAGKVGPVALQMHNAGLFDEFKDMAIEIDPESDELISTK